MFNLSAFESLVAMGNMVAARIGLALVFPCGAARGEEHERAKPSPAAQIASGLCFEVANRNGVHAELAPMGTGEAVSLLDLGETGLCKGPASAPRLRLRAATSWDAFALFRKGASRRLGFWPVR